MLHAHLSTIKFNSKFGVSSNVLPNKKKRAYKILSKQQLEHNEFGIEIMSQELKLVDFGSTLHAQCARVESYMHRKNLHAPVHVCTHVNRALVLC